MKIQDLGYVALGGVIVAAVAVGLTRQKAAAVKVLIVTDGSVDAESSANSSIDNKVNGKHKWNSKAASVTVYSGPTPAEACDKLAGSFTNPQSVTFAVVDASQTQPEIAPVLTTVVAANENGDKLHLTMKEQWRFAVKNVQLKRTLESEGSTTDLRLKSIVVNNAANTFTAANNKYLCAIFTD